MTSVHVVLLFKSACDPSEPRARSLFQGKSVPLSLLDAAWVGAQEVQLSLMNNWLFVGCPLPVQPLW